MDQNQKIRKLEMKLHAPVFVLIIVIAGGMFSFIPGFKKTALALNPSYHRNTGEQLDNTVWNSVVDDALDKNGDAMGGDLDMGNNVISNLGMPSGLGDAINLSYVNSALNNLGSDITRTDAIDMKMVCGQTGTDLWQYPFAASYNMTRIDIDTTSAGFTSDNVVYFTSLGGATQHFFTKGGSSVYDYENDGFRDGFTLFIVYEWNESNFVTSQRAEEWGWYVNWCGLEIN